MAQKTKTRKYKGKTYTASPGSISVLEDYDFDVSKAVEAGKFDWADDPYAAAQAAHIVATGEAIRQEEIARMMIRNILLEKKKAKKKKKKKRKVKCPLKNGKRDYKCEYQKYGGASKKGKKDRAARNKARKQAERMGLVKKGDGMEVDHIMPLSLDGSNYPDNWQIMTRADNRRKGKKWDGKSGSKRESIRRLIRSILLEEFSEQDVREKMKGDTRNRRGIFGAHAKDLFRQEAENNPQMREFLESLVTIHWDDMEYDDQGRMLEPFTTKKQKDELSVNAYKASPNGAPIGTRNAWGNQKEERLGFQVDGWISWLELGDAQTGTTGAGTMPDHSKNTMSGDNKQPRRTRMGRDRQKLDSMEDVVYNEEDFDKLSWERVSSSHHNEGLVDNWELVKIWYKSPDVEEIAQEAADFMSQRFGKQIPIGLLE